MATTTKQEQKTVVIYGTSSVANKLIVAAKATTCEKWEKAQEDLCSKMSRIQEVGVMERVAKAFGINPQEYDNEPYGVFIDNIWREAVNYNITIRTNS